MADFADLVKTMRKISQQTVESHKTAGCYFGTVISVEPIKIQIDPKHILTEEFIILGRYITEYSTNFTIAGETWRGLRPNDELFLMREQGGQRYVVVDWVKRVEEDERPAWIVTGEVLSSAPTIKVNDYLTLTPDQLILCRNVTEYFVDMTVNHITELEEEHTHICPEGQTSPGTPHLHEYRGRKRFLVHNGLVAGDRVLLVCERSLQKWYVVDFIDRSPSAVFGEWI